MATATVVTWTLLVGSAFGLARLDVTMNDVSYSTVKAVPLEVSYVQQNKRPTEDNVSTLSRARQLTHSDTTIRVQLGSHWNCQTLQTFVLLVCACQTVRQAALTSGLTFSKIIFCSAKYRTKHKLS